VPSPAVPRRVRHYILYYYAKLVIAPSAGESENYRFIIDRYKRLAAGEIGMSDYDREIQKLAQQQGICAFCGAHSATAVITIIPERLQGPVGIQNQVYACALCAAAKGQKGLFEWWCDDLGHDKDELPRIPAGLLLKMAYERHAVAFTLDRPCSSIRDLWPER
jgi:hypothetical protein